jgi:hypothetical protein
MQTMDNKSVMYKYPKLQKWQWLLTCSSWISELRDTLHVSQKYLFVFAPAASGSFWTPGGTSPAAAGPGTTSTAEVPASKPTGTTDHQYYLYITSAAYQGSHHWWDNKSDWFIEQAETRGAHKKKKDTTQNKSICSNFHHILTSWIPPKLQILTSKLLCLQTSTWKYLQNHSYICQIMRLLCSEKLKSMSRLRNKTTDFKSHKNKEDEARAW